MSGKQITIQNYSKFPLRWLDNAQGDKGHAPRPLHVPCSMGVDERTGAPVPGVADVDAGAWRRFKTSKHGQEVAANLERGVWREGRVIS